MENKLNKIDLNWEQNMSIDKMIEIIGKPSHKNILVFMSR